MERAIQLSLRLYSQRNSYPKHAILYVVICPVVEQLEECTPVCTNKPIVLVWHDVSMHNHRRFSSGLFPFSVFNWPQNTQDLAKFYPTRCVAALLQMLRF